MHSRRSGQLVLIVHPATIAGGAGRASEESEAVAFLTPDTLPELAFPENKRILAGRLAGQLMR